MATFVHVSTLSRVLPAYEAGIADLEFGRFGEHLVLYAATGAGGGIGAYSLSGDAPITLLDSAYYSAGTARIGQPKVALVAHDGGATLIPLGLAASGLSGYAVTGGGALESAEDLPGASAHSGDPVTLATLERGSTTFLYVAEWGEAGIATYRMEATQPLRRLADTDPGPDHRGADISDMVTIDFGGAAVLLSASALDDRLQAFRLGADGIPVAVSQLGAAQGLGIDTPSALEVVTVDSIRYAILASAGTSSLSVIEVGADGRLDLRDHVLDDLGTRFQGITALATATLGEQVFVVGGGADDGLSLFTLLPGGRLLHLASLADSLDTALTNVSAIAAAVVGGKLHVFAAGAAEPGLSQFAISQDLPGAVVTGTARADNLAGTAQGDVLSGGAGDDTLTGGAGADILVDGRGRDVLRGGGGRDIFVFEADGDADTVRDFETGIDRLDLSALGMLYSAAQLTIESFAQGARLRFGDELVIVFSHDGSPLDRNDFPTASVVNVNRPPLLTREAGVALTGEAWADVLIGGGGDDTLAGGDGADRLLGNDGYDRLGGGLHGDLLVGGAGEDTLAGHGGNDTLAGGDQADLLYGNDGNDRLAGHGGLDRLEGGAGADTLLGGGHGDTLSGASGADLLNGGGGPDLLGGGSLGDLLLGGPGHDTLSGHSGNDTLNGGAQNDLLFGGTGADTLSGNVGADTLYGGDGNDVLGGGDHGDALFGEAGADQLNGHSGRDRLDGGRGADTLSGGGDADTFVFSRGYGDDEITDFQRGVDRLRLDTDLWGGGLGVRQVLDQYATATAGGVVLDFGRGDMLSLAGIADPLMLVNDIIFG